MAFSHWYYYDTTFGVEEMSEGEDTLLENNRVYYAKWVPANVTISFDRMGGAGVANNLTIPYGHYLDESRFPKLTRANKTLAYWYTLEDGREIIADLYNNPIKITKNTKFYAKWVDKKVTISFNTNIDGYTVDSIVVDGGIRLREILPKLRYEGKTFAYWYRLDKSGNEIVSEYPIADKNETYHAKWMEKKVRISFDSNGGNENPAPREYLVDSLKIGYAEEGFKVVNSNLPVVTAADKRFLYWGGSFNEYNEEEVFDGRFLSSDYTLKAYWGPKEYGYYLLRFIVDSDVAPVSDMLVAYGSGVGLPEPEKPGFIFDGWSYWDGNKQKYLRSGEAVTRNLTLRAEFSFDNGFEEKRWVGDRLFEGNSMLIYFQEFEGEKYYLDERTGLKAKGRRHIWEEDYYFHPVTGAMQYGLQVINRQGFYFDAETGRMRKGFIKHEGATYFFDLKTGIRAQGLRNIFGDTYYFHPLTGELQYGLQVINRQYFYFDPVSGVMQKGMVDLNGNQILFDEKTGAAKLGFVKRGDNTYYVKVKNNSLVLERGGAIIGNKKYYFDYGTGAMHIGWFDGYDGKYYYNSAGQLLTGWQNLFVEGHGTRRFYFDINGKYSVGEVTIGRNTYYFDEHTGMATGLADGKLYRPDGIAANGIVKLDGKVYHAIKGELTKRDWVTVGRAKYFFNEEGYALIGYVDPQNHHGWYLEDKLDHPYLFSNDGVMLTGWQTVNGSLYFVEPNGKVKHGTHEDRGNLYYFNNRGEMQFGRHMVDGKLYFFDPASGRAIRGFINDGADYYFVNNRNEVTSGWQTLAGRKYYFRDTDNKAVRNTLYNIDGKTYYFDESGVMFRGWRDIGLYRYYFDGNGVMAKDISLRISNKWYAFDEEGRLLREGTQVVGNNPYPAYFNANGDLQTGLVEMGGNYYSYNANGIREIGWKIYNRQLYYFTGDDRAAVVNDFFQVGANTYYADEFGVVAKGWKEINGHTYMFNTSNGVMFKNNEYTIAGKRYRFDAQGILLRSDMLENGQVFYTQDGSRAAGLFEHMGELYFMGDRNQLFAGLRKVGANWYFFDKDNNFTARKDGFFEFNKKWYYAKEDGKLAVGLLQVEGDTSYFFNGNAQREQNVTKTIAGKVYYFGADGRMVVSDSLENGKPYYQADGSRANGLFQVDDEFYFMGGNNQLQAGLRKVGSKWYYFDKDNRFAAKKDGFFTFNRKDYYAQADATLAQGLVEIGADEWYFFNANAEMMKNSVQIIAGKRYYFGADGKRVVSNALEDGKAYYTADGS